MAAALELAFKPLASAQVNTPKGSEPNDSGQTPPAETAPTLTAKTLNFNPGQLFASAEVPKGALPIQGESTAAGIPTPGPKLGQAPMDGAGNVLSLPQASPLVFRPAQVPGGKSLSNSTQTSAEVGLLGSARLRGGSEQVGGFNSNLPFSTEQLQALLAQSGQGVENAGPGTSLGDFGGLGEESSGSNSEDGLLPPRMMMSGAHVSEKGMAQAAHGALSGHDFMNTLAGLKNPSLNSASAVPSSQQTLETALGTTSIQDKKKKSALGDGDGQASAFAGQFHAGTQPQISNLKYEINANVVQGAGAKDRLATASLMTVSGEIRNLAMNGGGEIRVRLRPDNLGELNIRVMTNGSRVGIQIQTSDEKSKKIIEESMNFLKESLSAQKLNLAQLDLSVLSGSQPGAQSQDSNSQNGFQFSQSDSWNMDMNQGRSHGGSENRNFGAQDFDGGGERVRGSYRGPGLTSDGVSASLLASQASAAQRSRGRIDVTV